MSRPGRAKRWLPTMFVALCASSWAGESAVCERGGWLRDKADDGFRPTPAFPEQTSAPAPEVPSRYRVQELAAGFDRPYALAFLPGGDMLVTDRPGRLRVVSRAGVVSAPVSGVPAFSSEGSQRFDLVLDARFARNRRLFFSYFARNPHAPADMSYEQWLHRPPTQRAAEPYGVQRIVRARLSADRRQLQDLKVIYEGGLPGRLVQARDGMLLFTSATPIGGFDLPADQDPQTLSNVHGKALRIRSDGSVPGDNPFAGRGNVRPEIYSVGMRDPAGAAIDPATGLLWTSENGPRGGDEINVHRPGANLGYPLISYGREYSGALINGGLTARAGLTQPAYFWTPSIAPAGIAFYEGALFPAWRGNLFVAAMAGKRLVRLVLDGVRVVAEEALLDDRCERLRTVATGPDGALYVLTDEVNGKLLRIVPGVVP